MTRLGVDAALMMVAALGDAYRTNRPDYADDTESLDVYRENDGTGFLFKMDAHGDGERIGVRADYSDEGAWGKRVASLTIAPAFYFGTGPDMTFSPGWFQLGDPCYSTDVDHAEDAPYRAELLPALRGERARTGQPVRTLKMEAWDAFITETGFGDGSYPVEVDRDRFGNIARVTITFIEDAGTCDHCGEDYCDGDCIYCPECGRDTYYCGCFECSDCGRALIEATELCDACEEAQYDDEA